MDYIKALNEVYNKHYVDEGKCMCLNECKSNIKCNYPSVSYRAKVGKKYGNGDCPKILFVGQEAPRPSDSENKTVLFSATSSPCTMKDADYNPHYLRTFYTLARLICNSKNQPKSYLKNDIKGYEYLKDYLCLTNFYKCVFSDDNKRTEIMHSGKMEQNCTKILLDEIDTLSPEVVVFQGKGHPTFWKSIVWEEKSKYTVKIKENNYWLGLYKAYYNEQSFYVIDSYHPTSHGIWTNNKIFSNFCDILDKTKELLDNK